MKKQTLIVVIIGGLMLLGLGFSYGSFLGQKQSKENMAKISPMPSSQLIKNWWTAVSGQVESITPQSISISSAGASIAIALSGKTKVKKIILTQGKPVETVENLSLEDVRAGNTVTVGAVADLQGNLLADSVSIHEVKQ